MIILTTLNSIAVLLCMYTLISKKYKTKSKDVTVIFLCLQFLFICNLWASIDGTFAQPIVFTIKNYIAFIMLFFCMYRVKKNVDKTDIYTLSNNSDNLLDRIGYKVITGLTSIIRRITKLIKK